MAITPNLNLEKPTVGADADMWGDKLNASLDILDMKVFDKTTGGTITGPVTAQLITGTSLTSTGNTTLGDAGTDTATVNSQLSANGTVGTMGQYLASRGPDMSPEWVTPAASDIFGSNTTLAQAHAIALSFQ